MSFGSSVGDFILLAQLAWKVVQGARQACGAHDALTGEVTSLHIVLRQRKCSRQHLYLFPTIVEFMSGARLWPPLLLCQTCSADEV